VLKFGGTSVSSAANWHNISRVLRERMAAGFRPVVVHSALSGITRDSVLTLARHLGLTIVEQAFPRELLYIADEVFFSGTAAEVQPIRTIDRIVVGDGKVGEITKKISDEFFGIANGLKPDRFGWLTPVKVNAAEPVPA